MRDDESMSRPKADSRGSQHENGKSPVDLQQVLMLAAAAVGKTATESREQ